MSRERKLVFDASLVFIISLFAAVLGYLVRMVLSRQLILEEFGLFYAVLTFVTFFSVFRDLGLSQSLTKFIPEFLVKKEYEKVKSSIKFVFIANIIISILLAALFILFSSFLADNYFKSALAKPVLIILSLYFVLYSIYTVFISIFVGFQKSRLYSLDLFLRNLFVLIGIFVFAGKGVNSPAFAYLFSLIFGAIIFTVFLFRLFDFSEYKQKISKKLAGTLFRFGFPLMFATVGFIIISQVDTLILTYFRPISEVGIYNVVLPTATLLNMVGSSLALAMIPLISEFWVSKKYLEVKSLIKSVYQRAFIIIVPIGFIIFVFSDFVLKVLFGESFVSGSLALKILSIGAIFFSFAIVNNSILVAVGNPKKVTITILVAAVINLVLNLLLIPTYGLAGAAVATMVSYIFVLLLSTYFVSKSVKIDVPLLDWFKIFLSGFIFILFVDYLRKVLELNVWLEVFVVVLFGLVVYFLLLVIFRIKLNFLIVDARKFLEKNNILH